MPYISKSSREELDNGNQPITVGELNYCITKLMIDFCGPAPQYKDINNAIGALECAKLEFYRRVAVPYEQVKILQNGDVYPPKTPGEM